ncbi:hypothetical protein [Undibacterium sp.]|uniref:hypothetical protein n=1 Tax=Undibacterium sp. TaxID=1914977 RepID=UPI0025F54C44|nr:hypothetical protein [Undibacterium sp.]
MQVGFRVRVLACIVITIGNRALGEQSLNLNQKKQEPQKKKGTRWGSFESGENFFTLGGLVAANKVANRAGHHDDDIYSFSSRLSRLSIYFTSGSLPKRMSTVRTTVIIISKVINAPYAACTDMSSTTATRSANQT